MLLSYAKRTVQSRRPPKRPNETHTESDLSEILILFPVERYGAMTTSITTENLVIDETVNLQDDDGLATAVQAANATIYVHLVTGNDFPRSAADDLSASEVAYPADFITYTPSGGSSITDLFFAKIQSGDTFDTSSGVNSGVSTIDGPKIWLFADATNENICLAAMELTRHRRPRAMSPSRSASMKRPTTSLLASISSNTQRCTSPMGQTLMTEYLSYQMPLMCQRAPSDNWPIQIFRM